MERMETLDSAMLDGRAERTHASNGKRFANYVIDYLTIIILLFSIAFVMGDLGYGLTEDTLMLNISVYILMLLYYVIGEFGMNGKTLGKLITRTKVVSLDGGRPDFGAILLRSLARFVPFEAFSFFGSKPGGWHDHWTKTMVMDESKTRR